MKWRCKMKYILTILALFLFVGVAQAQMNPEYQTTYEVPEYIRTAPSRYHNPNRW